MKGFTACREGSTPLQRRYSNMKKYPCVLLITFLLFFINPALADYTIIIDAGSTGSRLHLFQHSPATPLPLIHDLFTQSMQPGLSSYANHPQEAGSSLKPLFDAAIVQLNQAKVNPNQVSISVLGTAGMRLLPAESQQLIYASVGDFIKQHYAFRLGKLATISGKEEGLYGWLDINYLAQNFQQGLPTLGNIEMGGASTQITFATVDTQPSDDKTTITLAGTTYTVFSKSFLGLGQDAARAAMNTYPTAYTCYPPDYPFSNTTTGQFHFASCHALYADFLQQHHVEAFQIRPPKNQIFVATSAIYYAYDFLAATHQTEQSRFENRIKTVCAEPFSQLQITYPQVPLVYLSSYCANSTYIDALLYDTFGLVGEQLMVAKQINQQSLDWALGALLLETITVSSLGHQETRG